MPQPVLLIADPGIDGAFAIALALGDPNLDVVAIAASAGNVTHDQANRNVQIIVEYLDPPKRPRLGEALPADYDVDGLHLHGPGGLGGVPVPEVTLHHPHPADKLIVDAVQAHPNQLTIVSMAPLTTLARAFDRAPDLPPMIKHLIVLGGSRNEPGNATAVAEFRFYCDPAAARQVLRAPATKTLIPLDVLRRALFAPTELLQLPAGEKPICELLRKAAAAGIGLSARHYAVEGFYLKDVLGVCLAAIPDAFKTRPAAVDVETRGELTRGMSVFDARHHRSAAPNLDVVTEVDLRRVHAYLANTFQRICRSGDSA